MCLLQKSNFLWKFQPETNMVLDTSTKFRLELLIINVISGIIYFLEINQQISRNVSKTAPSIFVLHSSLTHLHSARVLDINKVRVDDEKKALHMKR